MCDACIQRARELIAAMGDEQRAVVEKYIEMEVEREKEDLDHDNDNLTERMGEAELIVAQIKDVMIDRPRGDVPLNPSMTLLDMAQFLTAHTQVMKLLDELSAKLDTRGH